MASYPTKLVEAFASKALQIYYQSAVSEAITNQDYEGEIKEKGSVLNILTFSKIASRSYNGTNMSTPDSLAETNAQLITNQATAFYFQIKSYDKFRSFIKSPEGTILEQTANELKKVIDAYVLGFYTKVQAGNRIGTNYTAGTIAIDSSGNVTGTGTAFTSAMVGRGLKAAGMTGWVRVATVPSGTTMTVVDDLDDTGTGGYSQGVIGAGATYTIEAVTPVQVTKSTVYDYFNQLKLSLDNNEIPETGRWAVIPPDLELLVREAPEVIPSGSDAARTQVVMNGALGLQFAGFNLYKTPRVSGSNSSTTGWHVIAGHKSAITFAMGFVENGIEDLIGNFGKAYKSLNVYGAKVPDERRKALTELFCYR